MRKVSIAAMLAVLASLLMAAVPASADIPGPASGDGVVPTLVDGNPSCQTLGYEFGFKIEGAEGSTPANGTYPPSVGILTGTGNLGLPGTLTISNSDGQFFNWSAAFTTSAGVDAVIVKGGDNADSFVYVPEDTADTLLHAPFKDAETPRDISHVEFCYDLEASVKVDKKIPNVVTGSESITVTFVAVLAGQDPATQSKGTCSVTFTVGETSESCTITGLKPNTTYDIYETVTGGFNAQPSQQVKTGAGGSTVDGPTFENEFDNATAAVAKVTIPAGSENGWTFDLFLDNDGTPGPSAGDELIDTVTTTNAHLTPFAKELVAEGNYYIAERPQEGFDSNGGNEFCSFKVDYPAANGVVFDDCVFTNTKRGKIIVKKVTDPAGSSQVFAFTSNYGPNFNLTDGQENDSGLIVPGKYHVAETPVSGWDLTSATCDQGETIADIDVGAGETVTCTFNNRQRGHVTVKKTTDGVVNPARSIDFKLTGPGLPSEGSTLNTFGDVDGILDGFPSLTPGETYTICENPVPAGFTSFWKLDGEIVTPYNPNATDVPTQDLGVRCYVFSVEPGQTVAFVIDNSHPGGEPRTIGYWKNWNSCTGGGQSAVAVKNGGANAGFFLVENLLPQKVGDFDVTLCTQAVKILSKQDQAGKSKANDAAYELAAQLLAAKLNLAAGAETCTGVQTAVADGQALLANAPIDFTGSGDYLGPKVKGALLTLRSQALSLATTLDRYNNGNLC